MMQSAACRDSAAQEMTHVGVPSSCFGETEYFASKASLGPVNPVAPNPAQ